MTPSRPPTGSKRTDFLVAAARYTAVAMSLPVSVFVGYYIGDWLDQHFGTSFLKIVFLLLGAVSGFLQLARELLRHTKSK